VGERRKKRFPAAKYLISHLKTNYEMFRNSREFKIHFLHTGKAVFIFLTVVSLLYN
jgi:hypothetical protein